MMSPDFREIETTAHDVGFDEPPRFIIETDHDPEIETQLAIDLQWLLKKPATRLLALRKFAQTPEETADNSVWKRLTDKTAAICYYFDDSTEEAIRHDDRFKDLIRLERSRGPIKEAEADQYAFQRRVLRLEVFLERAHKVKALGDISLSEDVQ